MAFLPVAKVQGAFASLRGTAPDIANPIVDCISNTYVYVNGTYGRANVHLANGNVGIRMRRMPLRFPIELWNVHDATLSDGPRTNNMCEGFNNRFLQIVGYKHPGIWKFIAAIKDEDAAVTTLIQQDNLGEPPQKKTKRNYQQLQARLKTLCQDVASGTRSVDEFLRGVAHNIRWAPVNREAIDDV